MKLNLGCGRRLWDGFVNVDLANNWSGEQPDIVSDLRTLPFDDGVADEVHAIHVIEHFYRWESEAILREWTRVLKPGGLMVLECPCLDKVIGNFVAAAEADEPLDQRMTMWGLFGDPGHRDPAMTHHWCFGKNELAAGMIAVGLENIRSETPKWHMKNRDMRLVGTKRA